MKEAEERAVRLRAQAEAMLEEARREAEDHWAWLETVLKMQQMLMGKLYVDAFIHGWKHGCEK